MNKELAKTLDDFSTPYNNDKTSFLLDKIMNSKLFGFEKLQEIQNYLVSKKGTANLDMKYSKKQLKIIRESIKEIKS